MGNSTFSKGSSRGVSRPLPGNKSRTVDIVPVKTTTGWRRLFTRLALGIKLKQQNGEERSEPVKQSPKPSTASEAVFKKEITTDETPSAALSERVLDPTVSQEDAPAVPSASTESMRSPDEDEDEDKAPMLRKMSSKRNKLQAADSVATGAATQEQATNVVNDDASSTSSTQTTRLIVNARAPDSLDVVVAKIRLQSDPIVLPDLMESLTQLRKYLSREVNPPIQQVVDSGITIRLVELLQSPECSQLMKFELAWILTNIASGSPQHTAHVVNCGAVPVVARLLWDTDVEVVEQAAWCLGNIAGDSAALRDTVAEAGVAVRFIEILGNLDTRISTLRNTCWAISNMCRNKPYPPWSAVEGYLPAFAKFLTRADIRCLDREALQDVIWAISYLSDGPDYRIERVLESGVLPHVLSIFGESGLGNAIRTPALRVIGNVVSGNDLQTGAVMSLGAARILAQGLRDETNTTLLKELCWALSNICAGNQGYLQMLLDEPGLIDNVVQLVIDAPKKPRLISHAVLRESAYVLANAMDTASQDQLVQLLQKGAYQALTVLMKDHASVAFAGLQVTYVKLGVQPLINALCSSNHFRDQLQVSSRPLICNLLDSNSGDSEKVSPSFMTILMVIGYSLEDGDRNAFELAKGKAPRTLRRMQEISALTMFTVVACKRKSTLWLPLDLVKMLKAFLYTRGATEHGDEDNVEELADSEDEQQEDDDEAEVEELSQGGSQEEGQSGDEDGDANAEDDD